MHHGSALLLLQHRDGLVTEPRFLLHLPHPHRLRGDGVLARRLGVSAVCTFPSTDFPYLVPFGESEGWGEGGTKQPRPFVYSSLLMVHIRDIYRPTERATAMGWFLSGTLIGPAIGPFLGGIIVTYTSWRVIFWVQTGLSGLAVLGTFFLLPETIHHKKYDDLQGLSNTRKMAVLWDMVNPWRVVKLMVSYPNL